MCWISRGRVKVRLTQRIFSYFPCQFLAKTSRHFWYLDFWYFTAMKIFSSSNFQKETLFKRSLSIYNRAVPGAIDYSPKKKRWPFLNSFSLPHYSLVSVFATFFLHFCDNCHEKILKSIPGSCIPHFVFELFYVQTHTPKFALWLVSCPNVVGQMLHWEGVIELIPPEWSHRSLWSFWYFCHFTFV